MKILHTADWHIGKVLYKYPLEEEHRLFFDWLLELIKEEEIDLILISGDIFDLSNPAAKDRQLYYHFLSQLMQLNVKAIITGGNHDSVGVLNAPREVLEASHITVVGGAKEHIDEELVEVRDEKGEVRLVVAAVPFLRDRDLRTKNGAHQYDSRIEAIRQGIKQHYQDLAAICVKKYKEVPAIAMGHLYAKGVISSDSERDIHIGNAAAVSADIFPSHYDYVALGHIHRPQIINKNEYIRYSGSPIALSFSEMADKKMALIIEIENGRINPPRSIPIPKYRNLQKISGSLVDVKSKLEKHKSNTPLPTLIEIEVKEPTFSALILVEVEEVVSRYAKNESLIILKSKTIFESGSKDTSDLFAEGDSIENLKPADVFQKKLDVEQIPQEKQAQLLEAFAELLESVMEEEG